MPRKIKSPYGDPEDFPREAPLYEGGENFFERLMFGLSGGAAGKPSSKILNSKLKYQEAQGKLRSGERRTDLESQRDVQLSQIRAAKEQERAMIGERLKAAGWSDEQINAAVNAPEVISAKKSAQTVSELEATDKLVGDAAAAKMIRDTKIPQAESAKADVEKQTAEGQLQGARELAELKQRVESLTQQNAQLQAQRAGAQIGSLDTPEQNAARMQGLAQMGQKIDQIAKDRTDLEAGLQAESTKNVDQHIAAANQQLQNTLAQLQDEGSADVRAYQQKLRLGLGPVTLSGGGVHLNPAAGVYGWAPVTDRYYPDTSSLGTGQGTRIEAKVPQVQVGGTNVAESAFSRGTNQVPTGVIGDVLRGATNATGLQKREYTAEELEKIKRGEAF